ncbi:MAG: MBL fold metallo-hydrolase [Sedimentitalea sp.]
MKPQALLKGQPNALFVLDYGLFRVHSGPRDIGLCGYLIRTDAGENVLIDTGLPAKYAHTSAQATAQDRLGSFGQVLSCTPENLPEAQLARAGVRLDQITLMIQSHTHIDHIGGIDLCPSAPMVIASAERALPRPLYWGDVQPINWPQRDYIQIDQDSQIGPGFEVLLCPGHAPGQLAFLIDLPNTGAGLLTSDAISRPGEVDEAFAGSWDEAQACHHGARLLDRARARDATVIFGHCPAQWQTIAKAPDGFT